MSELNAGGEHELTCSHGCHTQFCPGHSLVNVDHLAFDVEQD